MINDKEAELARKIQCSMCVPQPDTDIEVDTDNGWTLETIPAECVRIEAIIDELDEYLNMLRRIEHMSLTKNAMAFIDELEKGLE